MADFFVKINQLPSLIYLVYSAWVKMSNIQEKHYQRQNVHAAAPRSQMYPKLALKPCWCHIAIKRERIQRRCLMMRVVHKEWRNGMLPGLLRWFEAGRGTPPLPLPPPAPTAPLYATVPSRLTLLFHMDHEPLNVMLKVTVFQIVITRPKHAFLNVTIRFFWNPESI